MLEVTGSSLRDPLRRAARVDDPTRRCPDITLAREVLGWSPTVDLREGLQRTYEWYQRRAEHVT